MEKKQAKEETPLARAFAAMPDPPRAYVQPFDRAERCGLIVNWAAKDAGFGQITLVVHKGTRVENDGEPRVTIDTERMGDAFVGRMFMAVERQNALAKEHGVALKLLAPSNPDATLVEAVNNLRQVAASAIGNTQTMEDRLRRCLRALREGMLAMDQRGSARQDWQAGVERVVAECGVGIDDAW